MNNTKMKRNFVPYPFYWDNVPIDISFIFDKEKPAGKHGFLQVKGQEFVFEDGTPGRFWGTNFNSGSNFPPFEYSEKIAKRLSKIGINMVRFHQLDSEWATPNIFQYTKGQRKGNTLDLDPESMKRLDYLIFCLKQEGIYMYMDLLTYRKFKSGDGIENSHLLADAAKPYGNYYRKLIELQKKFNYDIWNHINPYTGLAYKDDPAIVLTEVVNESDMFTKNRPFEVEPYKSDLMSMYKEWISDKGLTNEGVIDLMGDDPNILEFKCAVQEAYYKEMIEHMRKAGVKIPITGTNWAINAANRSTQRITDFADSHSYWYGWMWKEKEKKFDNRPMVAEKSNFLIDLAFSRLLDRPFFVSEWDYPWPNEWRAESSVFLAAVSSLQNWCGATIHTYAYSSMAGINLTGKEVSSGAIGSVPYREGVFNTWNDPAKFGLFYHCALMIRRQDVEPARKNIAINIDDLSFTPAQVPALKLMCEKHIVGMQFKGEPNTEDNVVLPMEQIAENSGEEILSDTGQLYRNWAKRYGWIDSKRTKCAYGFLGENTEISLDGLTLKVETDFATIALSSLTNDSIEKSDNLLLTTVGRSENTGMKFNEDHTVMLDIGNPPILIEVVEAEIKIKTDIPTLKVWSINAEGFFAGVIPSEHKEGILSFRTGDVFPSMYYLIQAE